MERVNITTDFLNQIIADANRYGRQRIVVTGVEIVSAPDATSPDGYVLITAPVTTAADSN